MSRSITQSEKNEILPLVAMWMDLENIMFSEISQTLYDITDICGI